MSMPRMKRKNWQSILKIISMFVINQMDIDQRG
jgi:hypothetical protein